MEKKLLQKQNLLTLVEYISSSIDIIISLKLREEMYKINKEKIINDNCADNYEILLRKEERNIREHIANENQLKLHIKSLTDKLEEYERDNLILLEKIEKIKKKQDEKCQNEINNLKSIIKNYEIQIFKITQNENKLREKLQKKENEIKNLESQLNIYRTNNFLMSNSHSRNNFYHIPFNINNNIKINYKQKSNSLKNNKRIDKSHSNNTSLSSNISRSISKNEIKNKNPISERNLIQNKLDEYKKLIDRKINEMTRNKKKINLNKTTHCRSLSNKEKSLEYDMSLRYNDLHQKLNDVSIRIIKGDINKYKTPNKNKFNKSCRRNIYSKKSSSKKLSSKLIKKGEIPLNENKLEFFSNSNINGYKANYNSSSLSSINRTNFKSNNNISIRQFIFSKLSTNHNTNKNISKTKF